MADSKQQPEGGAGSDADPLEESTALQLQRIRRESERMFRQLVDGERRFRRLSKAVWRIQEEERRRIAGELHDGLGQTLTALKIQLNLVAARAREVDSSLAADLDRSAQAAEDALNEARRLSHLLRPRVLDDLGLLPAVKWLARSLSEMTGVAVFLEHEGLDPDEDPPGASGIPEDGRLDRDLETVAFRVLQEAATNALKYSGSPRVRMRLEYRASRRSLYLRVEDDGCGFDAKAVRRASEDRSGSGLRGIRDRVDVFNGHLGIHSGPGEGTIVEVELPVVFTGEPAEEEK